MGLQAVLLNLYLLRLGFDAPYIGLLAGLGQRVWAAAALPAAQVSNQIGTDQPTAQRARSWGRRMEHVLGARLRHERGAEIPLPWLSATQLGKLRARSSTEEATAQLNHVQTISAVKI
jgi:hypothetical protein